MKNVMITCLIISSLLLIATIFLFFKQLAFVNNSDHAIGNVINFKIIYSADSHSNQHRFYHPIVKYTNKYGKPVYFLSNKGDRIPQYELGEQVEVFYQLNHAEIEDFNSIWLTVIIFGIVSMILSLITISYFGFVFIKDKLNNKLITKGFRIETTIQSIKLNNFLNLNTIYSYHIYTQWVDEQQPDLVYTFKSERIWFNPVSHINQETISVYIDEIKPSRYYMDVRFLTNI